MRQLTCNMDSHCCFCACVDETSTPQQIALGQAVLAAFAAAAASTPPAPPATAPQAAGLPARKPA